MSSDDIAALKAEVAHWRARALAAEAALAAATPLTHSAKLTTLTSDADSSAAAAAANVATDENSNFASVVSSRTGGGGGGGGGLRTHLATNNAAELLLDPASDTDSSSISRRSDSDPPAPDDEFEAGVLSVRTDSVVSLSRSLQRLQSIKQLSPSNSALSLDSPATASSASSALTAAVAPVASSTVSSSAGETLAASASAPAPAPTSSSSATTSSTATDFLSRPVKSEFKAAVTPTNARRSSLLGSRTRTDSIGGTSTTTTAVSASTGRAGSLAQQDKLSRRRSMGFSGDVALSAVSAATASDEDSDNSRRNSTSSTTSTESYATISKRDRSNTIIIEDESESVVFFKDEATGVVEVKAGALSQLVALLAPDRTPPDATFVKEFLYSFRAFSSPRELLSMLVARWLYLPDATPQSAKPADVPQLRMAVQLRVVNVLRRWLEFHAVDFAVKSADDDDDDDDDADSGGDSAPPAVARELHQFVRTSVAEVPHCARWSPILLALFHSRVDAAVAGALLDWSLPAEALAAAMARRDSGVRRERKHADADPANLADTFIVVSEAVHWLASNVGRGAADASAKARAALQAIADAKLIAPLDASTPLAALASNDAAGFVMCEDTTVAGGGGGGGGGGLSASAGGGGASPVPVAKAPRPLFEPSAEFEFDEVEPLEVARQLALLDRQMFVEIEPTLIRMAHLDDVAPNVSKYIAHFNRISFWVASEVVRPSDLAVRIRRLRLMLQMCEHLERLRDYNALFAAIAGLHNASLNRLKHTWAGVGPETHERSALEQLLELTKPNQNYVNYRKQLQMDTRGQLPCIPYFGLYLKDLLHIEDGNDSHTKAASGAKLINFEKMRMLAGVLENIHQYQELARRYSLRTVPQLQEYITDTSDVLDDKELYRLSLEREPRGAPPPANLADLIGGGGGGGSGSSGGGGGGGGASALAPGSPALSRKGGFLSRLRSKRLSMTLDPASAVGGTIEPVRVRKNSDDTGTVSGTIEPVRSRKNSTDEGESPRKGSSGADADEPTAIVIVKSDKKSKNKKK
jgi:hypothetical protein